MLTESQFGDRAWKPRNACDQSGPHHPAPYLWRLHPVVAWLNDRMLAAFGRHEAPILAGVPGLAPDETVFVVSGLVPNRKSHPLVYEWVGVTFRGERFESLTTFDDVIQDTMTTEETPWLKVICAFVGEGTTVVTDSATTTPIGAASAEDSRA